MLIIGVTLNFNLDCQAYKERGDIYRFEYDGLQI